ncbi:uncharacterized protein LOC117175016 [Belonocnema kinseyi]|uniref:uncharacterized protein LOC117175016 n=1 Tax=Belonocnema kinseyi TaxID=2817044 RepID=UPI00143DCD65|nr:uncharacterized protein LOC117175016 [Belonocnema kinseyi]XP_033220410.1 uncharacterized protein LOC117175016 [Belonocnema kinseyi]
MSHSVTIRTQTVTTNSSAIIINTGYLKSWSGLLKVLELILGIVCVGIMGYVFDYYLYYNNAYYSGSTQVSLFYFLMVTTFMIGTFILLLSFTASATTESILTKTIFELIYHGLACILLIIAAAILFIKLNDRYFGSPKEKYNLHLAAAICALANGICYMLSTIIAFRSYRGL